MLYTVVNFHGKTQDLNELFHDKKDAIEYYKDMKAKYPHITFAIWENPQGMGHFSRDITQEAE